MRVDLHCHSRASDGSLTPVELCERATQRSLQFLAITDHDTVEGYRAARAWLRERAPAAPLRLLPGVEYSAVWQNLGVHIVGLGIDIDCAASAAALGALRAARLERAQLIGERLAKLGMPGACEGALALAGEGQVGRPHFARFLLQRGYVASEDEAFDRYLGTGKPGDIKTLWPQLGEVVARINDAGGVAVLAHPLKYRQTATRLRRLVQDFQDAGGSAIEVVVGRQAADESRFLAQLCRKHDLLASAGSDFHRPGPWCELGEIAALPPDCEPVWRRWDRSAAEGGQDLALEH